MSEITIKDNNFILPKHADVYHIYLNVSKSNLETIIRNLFISSSNIDVFGYNNGEDFYWCRIKNSPKLKPYIEIKLINDYNGGTWLFFVSKTDNCFNRQRLTTNKIIKEFIDNFKQNFNKYESNVQCAY